MAIVTRQSGWTGGISDDPRSVRLFRGTYFSDSFTIAKHFDVFSNPGRITPYRSLEVDTNDGSTPTGMKQYLVRDFLYASASAKLYGLGQNGTAQTKIVEKADATTGNWDLPASSEGNGAVLNGCFTEFKDYLWGFQGTNQLWRWGTLSGSPSITNSVTTTATTITSVANGLIAADANLYLPYNNTLLRIAPGLTVTDAVISVPDNFKITSICNYGNYMAIGCAPISSFNGVSKVFLWNLSSDLFTETLNFGEGDLRIVETIEGALVGITDRYMNNATGAGTGSLIIQTYQGGSPQVVKEVFTQKLTGKTMPLSKAVKNNRLFFSAKIMTNTSGTTYNEGIWSYGRKSTGYPSLLSLDIIDENVSTSGIQAFSLAGNYFFIAHSADGSIDKTDDAANYSFTSLIESQILTFGTVDATKELKSFNLYTTPLPANASITVKYRMDSSTSYTTFGTFTTSGAVVKVFINIESTGLAFPSFNEVQFRIESVTGGAEIVGFEAIAIPLLGLT